MDTWTDYNCVKMDKFILKRPHLAFYHLLYYFKSYNVTNHDYDFDMFNFSL